MEISVKELKAGKLSKERAAQAVRAFRDNGIVAMENAASEVVSLPSDTLMRTFANEATAVGVPESLPVVVLNVAQAGLFWIDHVSVLLSTSVAVGWKE